MRSINNNGNIRYAPNDKETPLKDAKNPPISEKIPTKLQFHVKHKQTDENDKVNCAYDTDWGSRNLEKEKEVAEPKPKRLHLLEIVRDDTL